MKTFTIINGETTYIRQFKSFDLAKQFCENYLDHSKEIIMRETKSLSIKVQEIESLNFNK